jgi:hypothetical protein
MLERGGRRNRPFAVTQAVNRTTLPTQVISHSLYQDLSRLRRHRQVNAKVGVTGRSIREQDPSSCSGWFVARNTSVVEEQMGYQRGPAGLMRSTQASTGVAVEIFVERDVVPPARVSGEQVVAAVDWTAPVGPGEEDRHQSPDDVSRCVTQ